MNLEFDIRVVESRFKINGGLKGGLISELFLARSTTQKIMGNHYKVKKFFEDGTKVKYILKLRPL